MELLQGLEPEFLAFIQVDGRFLLIFMYVAGACAVFLAALAGPGLIGARPGQQRAPALFQPAAHALDLCAGAADGAGRHALGRHMGSGAAAVHDCKWGWPADGGSWRTGRSAPAWSVGFLLWMLVLSLVAMASSAYVKWRVVAGAVSLALLLHPGRVSAMIDEVFRVTWGHLLESRPGRSIGCGRRFSASIRSTVRGPGHRC